MESNSKKIGFLDDHSLLLEGIQSAFQFYSQLHPILFHSTDSVFQYLSEYSLDVFVTDLGMPDTDWVLFLQTLKKKHPNLPIVVLSQCDAFSIVSKAISLGICGYIVKSESSKFIPEILTRILNGEPYFSPSLPVGIRSKPSLQLNPIEEEILRYIKKGNSMAEIAQKLQISPKSVEYRLRKLRDLFCVKNTAELVAKHNNLSIPL